MDDAFPIASVDDALPVATVDDVLPMAAVGDVLPVATVDDVSSRATVVKETIVDSGSSADVSFSGLSVSVSVEVEVTLNIVGGNEGNFDDRECPSEEFAAVAKRGCIDGVASR